MTDEKVFGLPARQGRWLIVALGLLINLCLGSVYSWSVFRRPVESYFGVGATESGLPFMVFLASFAILMPIAGRYMDKYGPKTITLAGSLIVAAGWILSGYAGSIAHMTITYGLIAGSGVGIAYGGPIVLTTKWFPDKKGLAVGITLVGFGLSPLITAPIARHLIEQNGPLATLRLLGLVFLVLLVLLALPLRLPKVAASTSRSALPSHGQAEVRPGQMLSKGNFYGLYLCFFIATLSGLMAIGISSPAGEEIIRLNADQAALAVSVFAIFNGVGRPFFGWLTDRKGPRVASSLAFALIALASLGMLSASEGQYVLYLVSFSGFWLAFGGWLAIAPAATATLFGNRHYAQNYGLVYTAYGLGAIAGTVLAGRLRDLLGSYSYAFYPTAVLALFGIAIGLYSLKKGAPAPHAAVPGPAIALQLRPGVADD